jgi:ABC-type Zn uptake system ZnuABC Zn-binding protein ZnuA
MNTRRTAILTAMLMLFSSVAGCLDNDEGETAPEVLGKAMVSTYHVEQLVSAVGGDHIDVEMMSTTNVPVHDYEPSGDDVVRLQESDIFFYHGLNLEPWVESTLSTLGDNAPTAIQTHAMPSGETALAFEAMLVDSLCDLLLNGPFEATTLADEEHDSGHDDGHDDHGHEDHGHEENGHEEHGHAEAEKIIQSPSDCPANTNISIFHMEAGEHILEFEEENNNAFNIAVLQMPGGHAHHHHGHGDGPFEWAGIFEIADSTHTWSMQKVGGEYADPSMRIVLIPTDTATEEGMHSLEGGVEDLIEGDSCLVVEDGETMTSIAAEGSCFELHVGTGDDSSYTIDTTGMTGLAVFAQHVPTEFERDQHYLKDSSGTDIEPVAQEGAGAHGHGSHGDGHDDHGDGHDDHGSEVCHNAVTHENYDSNESECEAAGHIWMEVAEHSVCHNTTTHENYDSNESECDAAGHEWIEHHAFPEIHADYEAHTLSFPEGDEQHEAGYVVIHVKEEGDYGFAVPTDVDFHILTAAPKAFEWAGVFDIADSTHTWSMQAVAGDDGMLAYADPSMRLVLIPTDTATEEGMHSLEGGVEDLIEGDSCLVVEDGETMTSIAAEGSCFELHVGTGDDSSYTIDTTGMTGLAVFAQHVPTEFERDQHYLKDSSGTDIEPVAQEGAGGHHHDHGDHGGESEEEIEAGEGEEAFNYDPHSWLDPLSFKEQAKVVLEALKVAFPAGADSFTANAEIYMASLDSLHADFQATFSSDATCTEKKVIANHNAYSYLAKRYGLKFIAIHGLDPEGEPSASDIAEAVEEINEDEITVLFIEEYTSVSAVDRIVELTVSEAMPSGIGVEYLYTMEMSPKDSSDDYISLMRKSLESLSDGLGC